MRYYLPWLESHQEGEPAAHPMLVYIYIHLFLVSDSEAFSGTYYGGPNNVRFALIDPHFSLRMSIFVILCLEII
jgi:hypothetical protein